MRICITCNTEKPLSEFTRLKTLKVDGSSRTTHICNSCRALSKKLS